ncbi:MAG: hypothetical protein OCD01_14535 [Fibrobacterales bacterium]
MISYAKTELARTVYRELGAERVGSYSLLHKDIPSALFHQEIDFL